LYVLILFCVSCADISIQQLLRWSTVNGFDTSLVMSGNQIINDISLTRVMKFGDSKGVSCPIMSIINTNLNVQFFYNMMGMNDPMMESAHRGHIL
jgi:hypothetical protein